MKTSTPHRLRRVALATLASAFAFVSSASLSAQEFEPVHTDLYLRTWSVLSDGLESTIEDFDGDGKADYAIWIGGGARGNIHFRRGEGDGGFSPSFEVPSVGNPFPRFAFAPRPVDIDGDGILDIFHDIGGRIVLQRGHGGFAYGPPYQVAGFESTSFGVIDAADGEFDFIEHGSLHRGNGEGLFTSPEPFESAASDHIDGSAIADVDGDGLRDVIIWGGFIATYKGDSRGGLRLLWRRASALSSRVSDVDVADVTGDGIVDLVVTVESLDQLFIARGNGAGGFDLGGATLIVLPGGPGIVALADYDLDGNRDIAVPLQDTREVAIVTSDGHGGFRAPRFFPVPRGALECHMVEIDGDGRPDVAVALQSGTTLLLNRTYPVRTAR